jgi:hypothetical protein
VKGEEVAIGSNVIMTCWKVLSQQEPREIGKNYKIPQSRPEATRPGLKPGISGIKNL